MKMGVALLCHNAYASFERVALSLHNQTWPDWQGYVLDVDSEDHLERLSWPFNKVQHCGVLRDRFQHHHVFLNDIGTYRIALNTVLGQNPVSHIIGFMTGSMRFHYNLLTSVHAYFRQGIDAVQLEAQSYPREGQSLFPMFVRRATLLAHPPEIDRQENGFAWKFNFPPTVTVERLGAGGAGLIEYFT